MKDEGGKDEISIFQGACACESHLPRKNSARALRE